MSTLLRQTPGCQDGESLARVWQGRAGHTLRRAPRGVGGLIHHGLPDVSVFILGWENPNTCLISKGQREGPGANRRIIAASPRSPLLEEYNKIKPFSLGFSIMPMDKMTIHFQMHEKLTRCQPGVPSARKASLRRGLGGG